MTATPDLKPKRGRSPNYPGISLKEATERAGALYAHAQRHPVPVADAFRVWGFSPNSGAGGVVLGALKKFGLVADEGSGDARHVRLTGMAARILLDEEASSERHTAIRTAALTPPIHAELWGDYHGSLPPDSTLRFKLMREKSFTSGGAEFFIRQFRETVAFAGLTETDKLPDELEDKEEEPEAGSGPVVTPPKRDDLKRPPPSGKPLAYPLPLAPGIVATIEAEFPLTESNWERMVELLEAFRPGLTRPDEVAIPRTTVAASDVGNEAEGLTAEAEQLILKVEQGGVPAFMTPELERIARENGVDVASSTTPNEVIEALMDRV